MKPGIEVIPGELPPFWDRSVVFFSNIHSIFYDNVEESKQLHREILGATTYGARVMSILNLLYRREPNLIVLEGEPEASLMNYLSYGLGLTLPDHSVLEHSDYARLPARLREEAPSPMEPTCHRLRRHPAPWLDGFVTDQTLIELAGALGKKTVSTLGGSRNGNNKFLLYQFKLEHRLPTFETLIASHRDELPECLAALHRKGYTQAVVKAQIGASGFGMVKLDPKSWRPEEVPHFMFFEGPCMVQGWLDEHIAGVERLGSPSVQLFLNDDTVFLFDLTEQILSAESVHQGNMSPPPYLQEHPALEGELLRQAGMAGAWLHEQGYRGTASADFLVVLRGTTLEVILCEINARVTGATYPAVLARHFLPRGSWCMRNISFRKALAGGELLSLMERAEVLYAPGKAKGMLPFNFNTDAQGRVIKGQFLCLGKDSGECFDLLTHAWSELPVEWGYDRD
ncbi:MAG TPA: hypothetical protein VGB25_10415 [Candidatus Binatia bacterium]